MPSPSRMLRASTEPSAATIGPRSIFCCSSSWRALSLLSRSEDASNTVQREVNAISSANSTATRPYRRTIGRFTPHASFELSEFEAADQRGRVPFRPQRVVEQPFAPPGGHGVGGDARDVVGAVEPDADRQFV